MFRWICPKKSREIWLFFPATYQKPWFVVSKHEKKLYVVFSNNSLQYLRLHWTIPLTGPYNTVEPFLGKASLGTEIIKWQLWGGRGCNNDSNFVGKGYWQWPLQWRGGHALRFVCNSLNSINSGHQSAPVHT